MRALSTTLPARARRRAVAAPRAHALARPRGTPGAQRGFTLIEILIALLIGLFLTGALLTIVQTNRRVFGEQNQLAQMQDNERMAMTMMADVIQTAGYFPNPHDYAAGTMFPAAGSFGQGQAISGTYSAAPPGDQISVRYVTLGQDGILNCSGGSNTGPIGTWNTYVNTFQIVNGQLSCTMNGNPFPLVGEPTGTGLDITNMSVLYGVKTLAASAGNNVDTYMTAAQINAAANAAALWANIISVQVQLTFTNPLYATNPSQPQNVTVQRVIAVMNQSGPSI